MAKTIKEIFDDSFGLSSKTAYGKFMLLYGNLKSKGILARPITHQVAIECVGSKGMPECVKVGMIAAQSNKNTPPDQLEAYVWFNDHTKLKFRSEELKTYEVEFKSAYWIYYDACCKIAMENNSMDESLRGAKCLALSRLLEEPNSWQSAIEKLVDAVAEK